MNNARSFLSNLKKNSRDAFSTSLAAQLRVGTVISVDPLRIQIDQNSIIDVDKMGIRLDVAKPLVTKTTEENAGLPWNLYHKHTVTGETEVAGDPPHTHQINFDSQYAMENFRGWEGLRLNDEVVMISIDEGRRFIILATLDGLGNADQ